MNWNTAQTLPPRQPKRHDAPTVRSQAGSASSNGHSRPRSRFDAGAWGSFSKKPASNTTRLTGGRAWHRRVPLSWDRYPPLFLVPVPGMRGGETLATSQVWATENGYPSPSNAKGCKGMSRETLSHVNFVSFGFCFSVLSRFDTSSAELKYLATYAPKVKKNEAKHEEGWDGTTPIQWIRSPSTLQDVP